MTTQYDDQHRNQNPLNNDNNHNDRNEQNEHNEHNNHNERAERSDHNDRNEHNNHNERAECSDRAERNEHNDRAERSDRIDLVGHGSSPPLEQRLARSLGISATPILYKELSHAVVGAAIEVHRRIGPGKLESTYQRALACELRFRAIPFVAQAPISMTYRGCDVGEFFADFIVDEKIIIEIKAVERYAPVHKAQVLSYLSATKLRLGLLINFNVPVLWKSVCRVVR